MERSGMHVHQYAAATTRRPRRKSPRGQSSAVEISQVHPLAMREARKIAAGRRIVCLDVRTVLITNSPAYPGT